MNYHPSHDPRLARPMTLLRASHPFDRKSFLSSESADTNSSSATLESTAESKDEQIRAHESRNIFVMVCYQVLMRTAWVFKTETVIMPAFMDHIAGAGWLRGFLPVLNRVGQSVPPVIFAERLKNAKRKKWMLFFAPMLLSLPFITLSTVWFSVDQKKQWWMPVLFLVCYFFFFCMNGINQLSFSTVQGKLIRAFRRGRLMSISGFIGSFSSVVCLCLFLEKWLQREDGGFGLIFGFAGVGFVFAGLVIALIVEPADKPAETRSSLGEHLSQTWHLFCQDPRLRHIVFVTICFSPLMLLFPHYQALGRQGASVQSSAFDILVWVIAQNVAVGVYSMVAGFIADRFGNRLAIRCQLLVAAIAPVFALGLMSFAGEVGQHWYWITFCLIGIAPVSGRTFANYTLELTEPVNHPRYVSTLNLFLAIPFFASPLVGFCVDEFGFEPVFLGSSAVIAFGFLLTFRMVEPRHQE